MIHVSFFVFFSDRKSIIIINFTGITTGLNLKEQLKFQFNENSLG